MDLEKLPNYLEAILFVSGNGVEIAELMEKFELQESEILSAAEKLKKKYGGKSGVHIISYNGKLQLSSNPAYADEVSLVLNPIRERELSKAVMEVAAIVAYRQPITRLEIEQIRGVNSDYSVQMLIKHHLIDIVGRKEGVGKPLLFGTTDEFLKRFQISSLDELPQYESLLERISVIHREGDEEESLYREFDIPEEEEVPEFLKGETLEKVEAAPESAAENAPESAAENATEDSK